MAGILNKLIRRVVDILVPDLCCVCGRRLLAGEQGVCSVCLDSFPLTGNHRQPDGPFAQQFVSTDILFGRAAALYRYEPHAPLSRAIIAFKYHGRQRLARHFGRIMSMKLLPTGFFAGVDWLVPVPIHYTRRLKRGYNQSEELASGISDTASIPVGLWLKATHSRTTQTRLSGEEREQNASRNRFKVKGAPDLVGKHVMLIDDVCTTGATIRACIRAIHAYEPSVRVSVLTLSTAH